MNWREHSWELVVSALSWIVAIVVLVCLGAFAMADAARRRWAASSARTDRRHVATHSVFAEMKS